MTGATQNPLKPKVKWSTSHGRGVDFHRKTGSCEASNPQRVEPRADREGMAEVMQLRLEGGIVRARDAGST